MKTQTVSVDKIKTNPDNPRTISDDKLQQLVNSIQQFPEMLELRPKQQSLTKKQLILTK